VGCAEGISLPEVRAENSGKPCASSSMSALTGTRVSQAGLPETASPRPTAYHTIVQSYGCADACVPRSHPSAVPLLVFANTRLGSDKSGYVALSASTV
jgi:hypothetical protein